MNWEAAGAIGEILGAIVVVATLLYLSRQIAQQASAARSDALASWLSDYNSSVIELFKEEEHADLFRRGLGDFEKLQAVEQMRFHSWLVPHVMNAQTVYMQSQENIQDSSLADFILRFNGSLLSSKGGYQWWERARPVLDPIFVEKMDKAISESDMRLGVLCTVFSMHIIGGISPWIPTCWH